MPRDTMRRCFCGDIPPTMAATEIGGGGLCFGASDAILYS